MKRIKYILITLISVAFIFLLSQLISDMKQLNAQVVNLHTQITELQHRQQTLIESNIIQDKLIEEAVFAIHMPEPIKEVHKEIKPEIHNEVVTPSIPFIFGAVEGLKRYIFGW